MELRPAINQSMEIRWPLPEKLSGRASELIPKVLLNRSTRRAKSHLVHGICWHRWQKWRATSCCWIFVINGDGKMLWVQWHNALGRCCQTLFSKDWRAWKNWNSWLPMAEMEIITTMWTGVDARFETTGATTFKHSIRCWTNLYSDPTPSGRQKSQGQRYLECVGFAFPVSL